MFCVLSSSILKQSSEEVKLSLGFISPSTSSSSPRPPSTSSQHHQYYTMNRPLASERVSQSYNPGWELEFQCSHQLELEQGCPHSNTPVKGFIFINIPFLLSYCHCLIITITWYVSITIISDQNPHEPQRHPLCN